jgi:hypothetical protein
MQSQELVYPLYLDVSMMTSFLAALEDGIAFSAGVKQTQERKKDAGAEGEGGAKIPSLSLFSQLLSFDLRGKISENTSTGDSEELNLVKKHTETSLFIRLRNTLHQNGGIKYIGAEEDLNELVHGELVEVTGQIFRSPLSDIIEAIFRLMDMTGVELLDKDTSATSSKQRNRSRSSNQGSQGSQQQAQQNITDIAVMKMLKGIRDDLNRARVIDVILQPTDMTDITIVAALSLEVMPDYLLDWLLTGRFTLLGKVIQVLQDQGEEISLYQRTTFNYLDSSSLEQSFEQLRQTSGMKFAEYSSTIKAPAIQILPMAIFV